MGFRMRVKAMRAALSAGLMLATAPVAASESADFAGCDGLKKPKSKDDGMRGVASLPAYSFGTGTGPEATIAACTRALTGGTLLPTQTLRLAHLLRARAAAKLNLGATHEALADLALADQAIAAQRGAVFFDRSLGASLDLMRALALAQNGEFATALPLAKAAADKRPYALPVQLAATMVREAAYVADPAVAVDWPRMTRLEPDFASSIVSLEISRGNYASAIAVAAATPLHAPVLSASPQGLRPFEMLGQHGRQLLQNARAGYDLAYALAATGDVPGARAAMTQAADTYRSLSGATVVPGEVAAENAAQRRDFFAPQARLAEARIALAEGRIAAAEALAKETLPDGKPARDLLAAILKAKGVPAEASALPPEAKTQNRPKLGSLASTLLIAYESPNSVIDYQKSRPNVLGALVGAAFSMGTSLLSGIPKTGGFKETANADGTIKVEYDGSSTSAPMVQEMTLLRAAELARAAGKPGFAITARNDYSRWLTQTQYGREINRTPSGHRSELTIRMIDTPEAVAQQGFVAADVIAALGSLYYEADDTPPARGRR